MRKLAVEHVEVGAAHPASCDLDEDLVRSGRSHRQLHRAERHARAVEHHCLHLARHETYFDFLVIAGPNTKIHSIWFAGSRDVMEWMPGSSQGMTLRELWELLMAAERPALNAWAKRRGRDRRLLICA